MSAALATGARRGAAAGAPAPPAAASGERPGISLPHRVQHQRRRLLLDQILELPAELLHRHVGGGGEARQLVRIVEVVAPQPDHIAARDGVAGRRDVHPPRARPAGREMTAALPPPNTYFAAQ